ncbi:MAG: DUF4231 domain-containing protein [Balneola sp.]
MENNSYPSLFIASDEESNSSQKYYTRLFLADLYCIISAALLTVYSFSMEDELRWIYIVSAILLISSISITIVLKAKEFESTWYKARALAESCKTLTWRFMTCSESFEIDLSKEEVQNIFLKRLQDLKDEFSDLNKVLDSNTLSKPLITNEMKKNRESELTERKKFYLENRIINQKKWYSKEAKKNKKRYNQWFFIVLISQLLALGYVIFLISNPTTNLNLVGLFTTIASSAISWLQVKKHQELKQAYTTTIQDLSFIEAKYESIDTENKFSKFVLDAENAFSREHTTWVAQRRG